jgi:hypothetical protein
MFTQPLRPGQKGRLLVELESSGYDEADEEFVCFLTAGQLVEFVSEQREARNTETGETIPIISAKVPDSNGIERVITLDIEDLAPANTS